MMIDTGDVKLHAEMRGEGDVAILFLHYWGGTAETWSAVAEALPDGVRAIALDARGWGGSDRPDTGYDIRTMADDVLATIDTLRLKRFLLVGHSMGGKVAQLVASRRPRELIGVVLVAPSPAQGKILPTEQRAAMRAAYLSEEAATFTVDHVLGGASLPSDVRARVIAGSLAGAAQAKEAWAAHAIAEDVSEDLPRIAVPVLVIGGSADQVDTVAMLQDVVMPSLPGAVLEVVDGAGHLLPLEAPSHVTTLIVGWLDRCVSAGIVLHRGAEPPPPRR